MSIWVNQYNELSNLLKGKTTYQETMSKIYYEMSCILILLLIYY